MTTLDGGRIGIAAQARRHRRAAPTSAGGLRARAQGFGQPIGQHQMIQLMLADMATAIDGGAPADARARPR